MVNRRVFVALAGSALAGAAKGQTYLAPNPLSASEGYFVDWLNGFFAKALAAGLPHPLLARELSGLSPDPRVSVLDARQPEFARPVSAYVSGCISPQRVATGRAKRTEIAAFPEIERAWGTPRDVLIALWAMESNFGTHQGDMDVVRSLATLAQGRRRAWAEDQLIAALRMIAGGAVSRPRLTGSWAGAMGQTQILPSVYLTDGVTAGGGSQPDIWGSAPDALATAAHLLAKIGWRRGEGWAVEAILPPRFDYGLSEGPREPFSWWSAKGVRLAPGSAWTSADADAPAVMLLPAGAAGPAILALPNHFAIRGYNNSIAYALAVGLLADRFAGGAGLRAAWPVETPLSLDQRMAAQSALIRLGYDPGPPDGMIGAGTRQALRAWQKQQGLPADGYLSPQMLARLSAATRT
jgi:lytic murein transglycosylase